MEVTGRELVGDCSGDTTVGALVLEHDVEHLVLVEEVDLARDALLVERLQDHVAGAVGRITGPSHRSLAVVASVAAEPALVDAALGRAVERQAEVLELDDSVDGLAAHDLRGLLVDEVVAALDGVERVPLPRVLFDVGEGGAHAPLRSARVRTGGIELGDDGGAAFAGRLDRRP